MNALLINKKTFNNLKVNRDIYIEMMNLIEELVINKSGIEKVKSGNLEQSDIKILDQELRIVSEIQSIASKIGQMTLDDLKEMFNVVIEDSMKEGKKNLIFNMDGEKTEIDASVLDQITPLIKALFIEMLGGIPSGVENAKINVTAHTTERVFLLKVVCDQSNVVSNLPSVRRNFEKVDLLKIDQAMASQLLTELNYSQTALALETSKENLTNLRCDFMLCAETDDVISFEMIVPVGSSIMQGILVKCGGESLAIPSDYIETIVSSNQIERQKGNDQEMIIFSGHVISVSDISKILNLDSSGEQAVIIISKVNSEYRALLVDSIINQVDMVVKAKPISIKAIDAFQGTTILEDGKITLVLDVASIIKNY